MYLPNSDHKSAATVKFTKEIILNKSKLTSIRDQDSTYAENIRPYIDPQSRADVLSQGFISNSTQLKESNKKSDCTAASQATEVVLF